MFLQCLSHIDKQHIFYITYIKNTVRAPGARWGLQWDGPTRGRGGGLEKKNANLAKDRAPPCTYMIIYVYMYIYIYMYVCISMSIYMHIYIYIYTNVHFFCRCFMIWAMILSLLMISTNWKTGGILAGSSAHGVPCRAPRWHIQSHAMVGTWWFDHGKWEVLPINQWWYGMVRPCFSWNRQE